MTIFTWLILGHLIGDWLFQNDWMARNKHRHLVTVAGVTHFIIYTSSVMIVLLLFADFSLPAPQLLLFTMLLFVSHWLIDAPNLASRWASVIQQTDTPIVRIAVDQTFHLLVLALLIESFSL
ncbi:MAG: DUF3307 domain-containing protein [Chloroflexota bacterium]